ncbi:hypothetical protein [Roseimaritima sediminicola]|uniref:hypothetical protein n=1 Tax=Roseimaritima sediminicola TaxID=2662066 RepID=UPI0012985105|nr:hypothetical protein [Roseimaritima sediminicola]
MSSPADASTLLDRHFLEVRARLLEVAATLDRLDRAQGDVSGDPRKDQLDRAIAMLADPEAGRAERLQRLFSRAYSEDWRSQMEL